MLARTRPHTGIVKLSLPVGMSPSGAMEQFVPLEPPAMLAETQPHTGGVRLSLPVGMSPSGATELGAWLALAVMPVRTPIHGGLVRLGTIVALSRAGEGEVFVAVVLHVTAAVVLLIVLGISLESAPAINNTLLW